MCFPLSRCPNCDLVYASTLPPSQTLTESYVEAAYDSEEEARFAADTYFHLLGPWFACLPAKRRAIDVGTGNGALLSLLLESGFREVLGIEPSQAARAAAPAELRRHIRQGMFSIDLVQGDQPDLVCAFQTLEHLENPMAILRDIHTILRPGGVVALAVHDWQAPINRLLGSHSPIIDIEHLQLFSRRSLQRLLHKSLFRTLAIHPFSNTYPMKYWIRVLPIPSWLKRGIIASTAAVGLARWPVTLPVGNIFAMGMKEW